MLCNHEFEHASLYAVRRPLLQLVLLVKGFTLQAAESSDRDRRELGTMLEEKWQRESCPAVEEHRLGQWKPAADAMRNCEQTKPSVP